MEQITALIVTTILNGVGDVSSLVFNPHDDCFYGCVPSSHDIIKIQGISINDLHVFSSFINCNPIKGEESSKYLNFKELVPTAIDYYVDGHCFVIVVDGPTIYKKPIDGIVYFD